MLGQNVLFISSNSAGSLGSGDQAIYTYFQNRGCTITLRGSSGNAATAADASGQDLIFISASINSSAIGTMYRDVTVPVVVCESYLLDDMKMVASNSDLGEMSGQNKIVILDDTHPIASGFSDGNLTIFSSNQSIHWGKPASAATMIAAAYNNANRFPLFVYETGDQMEGIAAPAMRIGFFLTEFAAAALNNDGWKLFDQTIDYALASTTGGSGRVTDGLVVLYDFQEGSGSTVLDVSGVGAPMNLTIKYPNDATWLSGGGLEIEGGNIVQSTNAASKIINACMATDEITIEAWIVSADEDQDGPARIVTLSTNTGERNFTVGQDDEDFVVRLRTSSGSNNGSPYKYIDDEVNDNSLQHIVYTRTSGGTERFYVNGTQVAADYRSGSFSNWNSSYKFALANELTENRPWEGTYYLTAVYSKALSFNEVYQNYQAGNSSSTPGTGGSTCSATGQILYERWEGISGSAVANLTASANYPATPNHTVVLTNLFEAPANVADNYGARISGYVCPPQTGQYLFWIAGDDNVELWLSTDADPANKVKIAYHTGHTNARQWDKYSTQESPVVVLEAGKKYYIEALMKEQTGGDHLAVGWRWPDGTIERPIPTTYFTMDGSTTAPSVCSATGNITYQRWNNISGWAVSSLTSNANFPNNPSVVQSVNLFEAPSNVGDNYGARLVGYVCPPQTGDYNFWVAGDDNVELWLSTDDNPSNKVKIAYHNDWTNPRQWDKFSTQASVGIHLEANKSYYIEALVKESSGGDNLAVGWRWPDGTLERPIPGAYLSEYVPTTVTPAVAIDSCVISDFDGDQNRWVWMKDDGAANAIHYTWLGTPGKIITYDDGTANIRGTIVATSDPGKQWAIDVWFKSRRNWTEWSALGRSYKVDSWHDHQSIANANYPYWEYYEMDDSRSTFTGLGSLAGQSLTLTHRPADYTYGFQFGVGANDFNGFFGFSGWWSYSGSISGEGDFNGNLQCGEVFPPSPFTPAGWQYSCEDGVDVSVGGIGVNGLSLSTLQFTDTATIDSIIVEAVSKNSTPAPKVRFTASNGQTVVALARSVAKTPNGNSNSSVRSYRAVFGAASSISLADVTPSNTWSFVAYVFHSGTDKEAASTGHLVEMYFYRGSNTFSFPIATTTAPRDITFYIPITELTVDNRLARIRVSAGNQADSVTLYHPNLGSSLNITPITLHGVPGNISSLTVKVESPNSNGDSFVIGGYIVATASCDTCKLADGGQIGSDQAHCGPFDPAPLTCISYPEGIVDTYDYEWRYSSDPNLPVESWVMADGSNSVEFDPGYAEETLYWVRLSKRVGCTTDVLAVSNVVEIAVYDAPLTQFVAPGGTCAGTAANLEAYDAGSNADYNWTFAGAVSGTAAGRYVSATWTTPGSYLVTLMVSQNGCDVSFVQEIMIDDCGICDNITGGGVITGGDASCIVPFDPGPLTNANLPNTGTGALEFVWLMTTDPNLPQNQWTMIPNSNAPSYDPGPITETTYFVRCVRRVGCNSFRESNILAIEIVEGAFSLCKPADYEANAYTVELDLKDNTATGRYRISPDNRKFVRYSDGTAKLEALLIHTENSNQRWYATLWFKDLRDWGQWQHAGGGYYGGPDGINHPSWDYYVLDTAQSTLEGRMKFKNKNLSLAPVSATQPFQVGHGANTFNDARGAYGEFAYNGSYSGSGRISLSFADCQDYCVPTPRIAAQVILQAAYNPQTGEMTTALSQGVQLPLSQPFNRYPWFYNGTESVASIPNGDITDWLLIEVRDSLDPKQVIDRRAVFLKKDGNLADMDGYSLPQLSVNPNRPYYIAIISRNHLDVMSSVSKDRWGRVYWHEFFSDPANAYTLNGLTNAPTVDVGGGVNALAGGDANGDGVINATDFNVVVYFFFQFGYTMGDINCDGVVNATDYLNVVYNYFKFSHIMR
ncbi:MAG: hypothetical protein OHK0039_16770 [Bacteroidia bacterium]